MKQTFTCALATVLSGLFALTSLTHAEPIALTEVEGPITWGEVENVTKLRHVYLSGQPDEAALVAAKASGVRIVINLRTAKEMTWDEEAAVAALEMKYVSIPLDGRSFSPDAIESIEAVLAENRGVPTLVHCSSSNRAGGWLAVHLVTQHASTLDDALAIGRKTGITKAFVESAVRDYIAELPVPIAEEETK